MLFGKRIKELRESQKLPQRVVADALEITIPLYSRVERGERTLSKSHLPKLAQVLNVEENELLKLYLADQVALVLDGQTEIYNDVLDIAKNGIKKINRKIFWSLVIIILTIGLWMINKFWHNLLPTFWASLISILLFIATTFGVIINMLAKQGGKL